MPRSVVALFACILFTTCQQRTEVPVESTAAPAAAKPPAAAPPPMCAASKQRCGGLSQCAAAPLTAAAATIPARPCTFEDGQDFVDIYSWNAFLALNWPANVTACAANTAKSILDVRSGDGSFVVWQTYMSADSVFVNPGTQRPAPWCSGNGLAAGPQRVFSNEAKAVPAAKKLGGKFLQISEPGGDTLQASGDVLTDQSGRWVRYERLMNQAEYGYIVPNRWNAVQLQAMKAKGETITLPVGAIEIKSAWKVLTPQEISSNRYFTTMGIVCNTPDGQRTPCDQQPVTMGLVGLHIVQQVSANGTLFWSTFEQVDNEKVFGAPASQIPVNQDFAKKPYTELDASCKPVNQPTNVMRVTPIQASPQLNQYYRTLLGDSVFANYQLISTQWTTGAGESALGTPLNVANITLETYVQSNEQPSNQPTGCFGCHLNSVTVIPGQSGGHSFLFLEAKYATKGRGSVTR